MYSKVVQYVAKNTNKYFCALSSMATSEETPIRKLRYDGRVKKRRWEERRTDKGVVFDGKKIKENGDGNVDDSTIPYERIKRRKYAILLGYSGQNYFGMQRNPKMKTIEEDLFSALLKANYITKEAFEQVQNIQYQRAARTDKGVSAARQIISVKLPEEVDIDNINKELPEVIRIFGIRRVTKGFNSKSQCDSRTYNYVLPTVTFSKVECKQEDFRLSDDAYNEINETLKIYVGTKNYHNFTIKKKPKDPSAKRYMHLFECERPFLSNGIEFAVLKVKGQSFMMHQIRKMIALLVAVIRGYAGKDIVDKAFAEEKINIPKAPGLGLFLNFVHYDRYNNRYGSDGVHSKLEWLEENDNVEEFKRKYIYPVIIDTEIKERYMLDWLEKLATHKYDILEEEDEDEDETNEENVKNDIVEDDGNRSTDDEGTKKQVKIDNV